MTYEGPERRMSNLQEIADLQSATEGLSVQVESLVGSLDQIRELQVDQREMMRRIEAGSVERAAMAKSQAEVKTELVNRQDLVRQRIIRAALTTAVLVLVIGGSLLAYTQSVHTGAYQNCVNNASKGRQQFKDYLTERSKDGDQAATRILKTYKTATCK